MIKELVFDDAILSTPCEAATAEDASVAQDLIDTLASIEGAACLAANQIGSNKAIIAYEDNGRIAVMFNPKIKMAAQPYQTQESCLSLEEVSEVKRFQMISVGYQVISNGNLVSRTKRLSGWTAELVQHGIDHCAGKLV